MPCRRTSRAAQQLRGVSQTLAWAIGFSFFTLDHFELCDVTVPENQALVLLLRFEHYHVFLQTLVRQPEAAYPEYRFVPVQKLLRPLAPMLQTVFRTAVGEPVAVRLDHRKKQEVAVPCVAVAVPVLRVGGTVVVDVVQPGVVETVAVDAVGFVVGAWRVDTALQNLLWPFRPFP